MRDAVNPSIPGSRAVRSWGTCLPAGERVGHKAQEKCLETSDFRESFPCV